MDVIYTGIRQTPQMIVEAALQEDVDVIGLSILSGAHMDLFPQILNGLELNEMRDVPVIAGRHHPPNPIGWRWKPWAFAPSMALELRPAI